jgi:AraC-like DNA-binding protein
LDSLQQAEVCAEERARKVIQHIGHSDLSIALRIETIAAALKISASRLRHLFKEATGISISRYLKLVRLRRACELLSTGQVTVRETMAEIGMNDISHFGRDYKTVFGQTPRQARAAAILRSPVTR